MTTRHYYWDRKLEKLIEGFPPNPNPQFGQAPVVIGDSMDKYYHPRAERFVESRSELRALDAMHGTITSDKKIDASTFSTYQKDKKAARQKLGRQSLDDAVAQIDGGRRQFTEAEKAFHQKNNEQISQAYGIDAFNVAGKKNDKRGKKYRK